VAIVAGTALTTAALLLGGARLVQSATADADPAPLAPARPSFEVEGMRFEMTADSNAWRAGAMPTVVLTASNGGDCAVSHDAVLRLMASAPVDRMSRMVALPVETWSKQVLVALQAGESRRIELTLDKPLPAGRSLSFVLQVGERRGLLAEGMVPVSTEAAAQTVASDAQAAGSSTGG
jgi:hypothetical protein